MTLQARTTLNLIAGAIGGVVGWILIDLTGWFNSILNGPVLITPGDALYWQQLTVGGLLGCSVAILLGLVDALAVDSYQQRVRGIALHGLVGFVCGMLGIYLGQTVFAFLGPRVVDPNSLSPGELTQSIVAHAFGWAFIGAGVGVSQGVARRSLPLIQQGLFGGFAGGFVGGVIFQSSGTVLSNGHFARLLGFVCVGASTGFFIGLIQTLFRQAWVRVVLGRNEGKEYPIDKPVTVIGRSELADIGLFGNAKIMPHHCAIEHTEGKYRLRVIKPDDSTRRNTVPAEVKVNGLIVNPDVWLTDGDGIAIDDRKLLFRERLTQRRSVTPQAIIPAAAPPKPSAIVRIVEGVETGKTFTLNGSPAQIGRTEDCAISLAKDTLISRRHATIQLSNAGWTITDSGSANGTYVNSKKLEESSTAPLRSGDQIRVGETTLRIDI